ncbi:MAG: hypothetical protein KAJ28_01035 [Flavobacteriaceae bacterium]|nr:hypothetical protein [Flavobacteriaceae bacterium]
MNLKTIIAELNRRNVFKAGLAYLVIAWMIIQVAAIILPSFNAPVYFMKSLIVVLLIGFPIWIAFSWIYDITSEGIKRTSHTDKLIQTEDNIEISQRLNKVIIVALSIAVILLLFNQFGNQPLIEKGKLLVNNSIPNVIAVLPFLNNKPDPENDYFGFAIADQIIGELSYLNNITVRPSSSIRKYDNKVIDPMAVKSDLNVDYILTGSYLKESNKVRLNVELVELETDSMIWRSNLIEVDFNNTFELQDIVAEKVVYGMNIQFSEKEIKRIGKDIPQDPLAYEYYLRSISYPLTIEGDKLSIAMLNKAIVLDSVYAPAYGELGFRTQHITQFDMRDSEDLKNAEKYYLKALSLNPELLNTLNYLSMFYTETSRTEEAFKLTKKMIEINPNNASAHFALGYIYRYTGILDKSIEEMLSAIAIDPKNSKFCRLGITYINVYEYDKAFDAFSLCKENGYTIIWQGITLWRQGKLKQAMDYFERVIEMDTAPYLKSYAIAARAALQGNIEDGLIACKTLEDANTADGEAWYYLATTYAKLEDSESCIRCIGIAVDNGYYNYPFMITDPFLDLVRDDPRLNQILEQAKQRHIYFKTHFFSN